MLYFFKSPFINEGDHIDFEENSTLPLHFTYWRYPIPESYQISPPGHPNTLQLNPSKLNLTALNGNYAGPSGQTFVGRRQQETLFTYSINVNFSPTALEEEAGVSVFLTQNHHLDLGVVMLPASSSTGPFPGTNATTPSDPAVLVPQFRFRGISYVAVPNDIVVPVPEAWLGKELSLEIRASNGTHYTFSAGPADARSLMRTIVEVSNEPVSWGFTGMLFVSLGWWDLKYGYWYFQVWLLVFIALVTGWIAIPRRISRSGGIFLKVSSEISVIAKNYTIMERKNEVENSRVGLLYRREK